MIACWEIASTFHIGMSGAVGCPEAKGETVVPADPPYVVHVTPGGGITRVTRVTTVVVLCSHVLFFPHIFGPYFALEAVSRKILLS